MRTRDTMQAADWLPAATRDTLLARAKFYQAIRNFFTARNVLEVETPLLCAHTVTDPHIASFESRWLTTGAADKTACFLQTSPEYAMKRLLAAGAGAVFQICKAFRDEPPGRNHQPEFTMLEWYQPGYTHLDLMQEMDEFLHSVCGFAPATHIRYREAFEIQCGINPHTADLHTLKSLATQHGIHLQSTADTLNRDDWLQLLFSHVIEPHLGMDNTPVLVYGYPASQAALARCVRDANETVAARFEVYINGLECANGFYELTDADEQRARFERDNQHRHALHLPLISLDESFLCAIAAPLPECSGVAVGLDRLLMLMLQKSHINDVLTFPT